MTNATGHHRPGRAPDTRLRTTALGLPLVSPVIVASGPLGDTTRQIKRMVGLGAGAVVTKTIYPRGREHADGREERIRHFREGSLNSTTYSLKSVDEWLHQLDELAADATPVIVSIHADTPDELAALAARVGERGSFPLELGISCPTDGAHDHATPARVHDYTAAVRSVTATPMAVKMTAWDGLAERAAAAVEAGADALSISDSLPSTRLDPRTGDLLLGEETGYSGPAIKPLVLHAIRSLRAGGIDVPILGIGGVTVCTDVVEYLRLGAVAVQVYTVLMTHGPPVLSELVDGLASWCATHETTVAELVGSGLARERVEV